MWWQKMLVVAVLALCLVRPGSAGDNAVPAWLADTVWYEIFVRSFYDSDGDGVGDLRGVIEKLDYLNDGDPATTTDLGITGIWLMPIMEAASYHGYDVTDYFAVEQDYGTKEDFLALMDAAHARGIKVIVDMVLNHTSSQHEWFVQSRAGSPEYADWYIWSPNNPGYSGPWGQRVWYPAAERFYYAAFWSEMPDLNLNNPAVNAMVARITDYWLTEMRVDGFRLDAVKYMIEDEINGRRVLEDAPRNRQWLADLTQFVRDRNPQAVTVGEIWDATLVVSRYMQDNAVDTAFDFDLATDLVNAARTGSRRDVERQIMNSTRQFGTRYAPFTTNHDQTRLMTLLEGDTGANRMAAAILLTIPGSPFIYYGEEIGLTGAKEATTDEPVRTPMLWDDRAGRGFSTAAPWTAFSADAAGVSVAAQTADPDSLLSHYRALIHLRNAHPALRSTGIAMMDQSFRSVMAYARWTAEETLLVVLNLDDEPAAGYQLRLDAGPFAGATGVEVLFAAGVGAGAVDVALPVINAAGGFEAYTPLPELPAYSTLILRLTR